MKFEISNGNRNRSAFTLIDTLWLKAGPISNQLFDTPDASAVLNEAHEDLMKALGRRDSAGVRRAVEKDIFVAGQFLRRRIQKQKVSR